MVDNSYMKKEQDIGKLRRMPFIVERIVFPARYNCIILFRTLSRL